MIVSLLNFGHSWNVEVNVLLVDCTVELVVRVKFEGGVDVVGVVTPLVRGGCAGFAW